jgi:hypothetical protein
MIVEEKIEQGSILIQERIDFQRQCTKNRLRGEKTQLPTVHYHQGETVGNPGDSRESYQRTLCSWFIFKVKKSAQKDYLQEYAVNQIKQEFPNLYCKVSIQQTFTFFLKKSRENNLKETNLHPEDERKG